MAHTGAPYPWHLGWFVLNVGLLLSWLDSQPLRLNCCSVSRKLPCDPSPPWPPLASCWGLHGAGLQGEQQSCTHLPRNGGRTTRPSESTDAPLHQLASWYRHHWEQTKLAQRSRDSSLFWHISGGTNSRPLSGQQNHSTSSTKDSRLICSDFTSTPHSMTPCGSLWIKASAKCPKSKSKCPEAPYFFAFSANTEYDNEFSTTFISLAVFRQGSKLPICPSFWRLGPRF